jgi:monoamine oxidase
MSYVSGGDATRLSEQPPAGIAIATAAAIDALSRDSLELALRGRARTVRWTADPYAGGAYAAFAPGQITRYWRALRRPVSRIVLAGEHTDAYTGYMEGAIRSGLRAAQRIAA